jgi:hypothetical protein
MSDPTIPDRIEAIRAAMRAYTGAEDTPPMRVMTAMTATMEAIHATQAALDAKVTGLSTDSLMAGATKALRNAASAAAPEVARTHRWQRRCATVNTAAMCVAAVVVVGFSLWQRNPIVLDAGQLAAQCANHVVRDATGSQWCWVSEWVKPPVAK